jgi:maleate isomerase
MGDYLGYRAKIGVTTPSTNTVVQPEYDDMRPHGVTNHLGRMHLPDIKIHDNDTFNESIRLIDAGLDEAVDRVMTCDPDYLVLGISALSVWGGTLQSVEDLKQRMKDRAGRDIGVSTAVDGVREALKLHGVKKKIAIMEPYYPSIEPRMAGVMGELGYEIVKYQHMRGKSPATYSHVDEREMIEAIKSIDTPEVECLVQFGAALPMAHIADEAERWLNKPVISINVVTYWHGLRALGIKDQFPGFTSLFSRF